MSDNKAQSLLMMFIKDAYSPSGKVSKKTAISMMGYVRNDTELQRLINISDWKAVVKHTTSKAEDENQETEETLP